MKTRLKKTLLLVLSSVFISNFLFAQELENTLLWKIEGDGIHTSYIYGTMHLIKEKDFILTDNVKNTFAETNQLILELDMDNPSLQTEMMKYITMKNDTTLNDLIDEESYKKLDAKIKPIIGVSLDFINTWQPLMISSMLTGDIMGENPVSFESTFMKMAKTDSLEVLGLETPEDQLNIFHSIPYSLQAKSLLRSLNNKEKMIEEFKKLVLLYKNEDINGLYNIFVKQDEGVKLPIDIILHNRNEKWISKIQEYATDKASFIAVGAAHLGGEKGVISLLRKAGYTVTPILK